jgi:hypothetical protein
MERERMIQRRRLWQHGAVAALLLLLPWLPQGEGAAFSPLPRAISYAEGEIRLPDADLILGGKITEVSDGVVFRVERTFRGSYGEAEYRFSSAEADFLRSGDEVILFLQIDPQGRLQLPQNGEGILLRRDPWTYENASGGEISPEELMKQLERSP